MTREQRIEAAARVLEEFDLFALESFGEWEVAAKALLRAAYPELMSDPPTGWVAPVGMTPGYVVDEPSSGWRATSSFTDGEKAKLRPMAETLAMLDGNAFFGMQVRDGEDFYEQYLPEAHALYEANGGDGGWAGAASFARDAYTKEQT